MDKYCMVLGMKAHYIKIILNAFYEAGSKFMDVHELREKCAIFLCLMLKEGFLIDGDLEDIFHDFFDCDIKDYYDIYQKRDIHYLQTLNEIESIIMERASGILHEELFDAFQHLKTGGLA